MTDEYTPTTTDIRDGFAFNYGRDYETFSEGYYEALRFGEAAFSRWLADYTRQQREEAWDEGNDSGYDSGRGLGDDLNPYRRAES